MAIPDYLTVAEYRAWAVKGAISYSDTEIADAQTEVLERLEAWARTAWQTRTVTEKFDAGGRGIILTNLPVQAVSSVIFDGDAVSVDDYVLALPEGVLWFDTTSTPLTQGARQTLTVAYSYGFTAVPKSVKRPVMAAMSTLLPHVAAQKAGKIPPNTTEYRTEGATFLIEPGATGDEPWPWDAVASRDIRTYWGPHRPLAVGFV